MAVYKATHCYPMLNNVDSRVVADADNLQPAEFLKCQIDTSNKDVTGYSIRILDSLNNQLFPVGNADSIISPVSELSNLETNEDFVNTGLNGSFLHVPFFQNKNTDLFSTSVGEMVLNSYNAIYYGPTFKAHFVIKSEDIGSWELDSEGNLTNETWDGTLNGEKCLVDEVVLVQHNSSATQFKGGLWKFQQDGSLVRYYIGSKAITYSEINGKGVLILRGSEHDKVYTVNTNTWTVGAGSWYDIQGQEIENWGNEGQTFKWEITLYQGDVAVTQGEYALKMVYDNLDTTWYDMVLQTGSICGTTPKRLQLGSTDDSNFDAEIPAGIESDPLVLQGRWAQLLDDSNNKIGSRAYIKSYDASYGHAYPNSDAFSVSDIGSASKVEFYKYSNSIDYIEASDIVSCATTSSTGNIANLFGYTGTVTASYDYYFAIGVPQDKTSSTTGTTSLDGCVPKIGDTIFCASPLGVIASNPQIYKVNNVTNVGTTTTIDTIDYVQDSSFVYSSSGYYYINTGKTYGTGVYHNGSYLSYSMASIQSIDGVRLVEGSLVLVKNQTNAKENGVYVYHTDTHWTRSGSYDSWGDFIGKIIFVESGTENGGKNFESLANAGGTLYTGTSASSGDSPLYFTLEKPITLFSQDVYRNDIDLAAQTSVPSTCPSTIDGVPVKIGMLVYYSGTGSYGTIYKVISETAGASSWVTSVEVLTSSKLLYVNQGQVYGHAVVQRSSSTSIVEVTSLSKAYLMKNDYTRTYISPFIGLKKGMALKLQNNKKASFNTGNSEWIKLNLLMNKNTWCVQHANLSSKLKSYDEQDSDVPWTYEVRSFYRSSDESIFYCYETPYLKLEYNGEEYSDIMTWYPYTVSGEQQYDYYEVIKQAESASWLRFMIGGSSLSAITDRFITLKGIYYQFQQLSWVSYRWVLTDQAGEILQDTGKKFDKKMEASFYGLSNEEGSNIYYAILYVEDSLKQSLTFTVQLVVASSRVSSLKLPFHATFERQTHSVLLEYDDYGQILPSVSGVQGAVTNDIGYIENNSSTLSTTSCPWDSSIMYDDANLVITESNTSQETPIIDRYNTEAVDIENVSNTVKRGVSYSHYFPSDETIVETNTHELKVKDEEFSLQTEVQLNDNFSGDFLTVDLIDESSRNKYARLVLYTYPGMSTISSVATDRYCIGARIEAVNGKNISGNIVASKLKNVSGDFVWSSNTLTDVYYTLQPKSFLSAIKSGITTGVVNNKDFQYTAKGYSLYPWYLKTSDESVVRGTQDKAPLGNLCLMSGDDIVGVSVSGEDVKNYCINSLGYWCENRQELKLVKVGSPVEDNYFVTMTTSSEPIGSSSQRIWPSDTNEDEYYWIETENNAILENAPAKWSEVKSEDCGEIYATGSSTTGLVYQVAMPRYYNVLEQQKWKIKIDYQNISTLYSSLTSNRITAGYDSAAISTEGSVFFKDGSNNIYCKVLLTKEEV